MNKSIAVVVHIMYGSENIFYFKIQIESNFFVIFCHCLSCWTNCFCGSCKELCWQVNLDTWTTLVWLYTKKWFRKLESLLLQMTHIFLIGLCSMRRQAQPFVLIRMPELFSIFHPQYHTSVGTLRYIQPPPPKSSQCTNEPFGNSETFAPPQYLFIKCMFVGTTRSTSKSANKLLILVLGLI